MIDVKENKVSLKFSITVPTSLQKLKMLKLNAEGQYYPSRDLLVQSQKCKQHNNGWNLLTIKTPERPHWRRFDIFIVNCKQILHIVLVIP